MTEDEQNARPVPAVARRFGDEEIQRILARAAEMQERGQSRGGGSGGAGGLTLEDLRQVAAEAGIDPKYVDLAAVEPPPTRTSGTEAAWAGGPVSWSGAALVEGEVPEEDRDRLVQAIRRVTGRQGKIEDVYGRMEWSHDDGLGPIIVGVTNSSPFCVSLIGSS